MCLLLLLLTLLYSWMGVMGANIASHIPNFRGSQYVDLANMEIIVAGRLYEWRHSVHWLPYSVSLKRIKALLRFLDACTHLSRNFAVRIPWNVNSASSHFMDCHHLVQFNLLITVARGRESRISNVFISLYVLYIL